MDPCFHQCPYNKVLGNFWLKKTKQKQTNKQTNNNNNKQTNNKHLQSLGLCAILPSNLQWHCKTSYCVILTFSITTSFMEALWKQSFFMTYCIDTLLISKLSPLLYQYV